ncbi:hypothetical protein YPPY14_4504, partial [Yersinia pestis PY-14]
MLASRAGAAASAIPLKVTL